MDKNLTEFLQQQKLLTIATVDTHIEPWVANVYYSVDDKLNFFFVSEESTNHSEHIKENNQVAFTVNWYDSNDLGNRKAIQGKGTCRKLENPQEIISFLANHYKYFPLWKETVNYENMLKKIIEVKPYIIKPSYIKFWNDELYGEEGIKDFRFN